MGTRVLWFSGIALELRLFVGFEMIGDFWAYGFQKRCDLHEGCCI